MGGPPLGSPYVSLLPSGGVNLKKGGAMFSINFPGNFRVCKYDFFFVYLYYMKKIIKKVLREQTELPTTDIFHISIGENWDRGYNHTSDLFFKDYDKAVEYLISNGYEKSDYPSFNKSEENWGKGYGYQAKLTTQKLIV